MKEVSYYNIYLVVLFSMVVFGGTEPLFSLIEDSQSELLIIR